MSSCELAKPAMWTTGGVFGCDPSLQVGNVETALRLCCYLAMNNDTWTRNDTIRSQEDNNMICRMLFSN
eukprot:scaffold6170_cov136-Skeletonema_menzelii.AAC.11